MTERRPRRRPGENRDRLLKAGLIEFGLHGFYGASTSAIALRAEVPQPHVYASFTTKRELFLACLDEALTMTGRGGADPDAELMIFQAFAAARAEPLAADIAGRLSRFPPPLLRRTLASAAPRLLTQLPPPPSTEP